MRHVNTMRCSESMHIILNMCQTRCFFMLPKRGVVLDLRWKMPSSLGLAWVCPDCLGIQSIEMSLVYRENLQFYHQIWGLSTISRIPIFDISNEQLDHAGISSTTGRNNGIDQGFVLKDAGYHPSFVASTTHGEFMGPQVLGSM